MYFVVFILQTSEHIVVPHTWIKLTPFIERIINGPLNSNIIFEVFYTKNDNAFHNGIPRADFLPNLSASTTSKYPNEGWYQCNIRRFNCKCSLKLVIVKLIY